MKTVATPFGTLALVAALALPAATAPQSQVQEKLPDAAGVIDRHIEATGGSAAYRAKKNQLSRGKIEIEEAGVRGTVLSYEAVPRSSYMKIDLPGAGIIEEGTLGDVAWERSIMMGPRVKTGEERAAALRDATFHALLSWRELYLKAECVGVEDVQGVSTYKVILTPEKGNPLSYFFERESGLLVKIAGLYETQMGRIPAESLLGDYREVDGIRVAHRLIQKVMTMTMRFDLEEVRFNVDVPPGQFDIPEDVKPLLRAK